MKVFKWKGKKSQIPAISNQYPIDPQQVPDIFVHIYTNTMMGAKRIGYVRVPVRDDSLSNVNASWYQIKDPTNNFDGPSPGLLLANLRLMTGPQANAPRGTIRYDNETLLNIYAFVYSCVELSPETHSQKIRARVEINFCDLRPNETAKPEEKRKDNKLVHKMYFESTHKTRNPIFGGKECKGEFLAATAKVTGGIEMAPNVNVTVSNLEDKIMFTENYREIGSCYISPNQCKIVKGQQGELKDMEPTVYTLIGGDGRIQGKILMFLAFSKNLKDSITLNDFKAYFDVKFQKFKLNVACIGARNLDANCPNPEVIYRIPSYELEIKYVPTSQQQEIDDRKSEKNNAKKKALQEQAQKELNKDMAPAVEPPPELTQKELYLFASYESSYLSTLKERNPNICLTSKIKNLLLPKNHIYWPRMEIQIIQKGLLMTSEYFTTVNLIECTDGPQFRVDLFNEKLGITKLGSSGTNKADGKESKGNAHLGVEPVHVDKEGNRVDVQVFFEGDHDHEKQDRELESDPETERCYKS